MFDQLFKRASTRARYVTAPFAEERARYLDYCELRGDSRSQQLRKAHDLLWIARKLNSLRCARGMVSAASGRYHSRAADLCAGETASRAHVGRCGAAFCGIGCESVRRRA